MKNKKIAISIMLVTITTWATALFYQNTLPESIPTHWNFEGEVDGYMSKPWGVYIFPMMSTVISLALWFLPKIAPKGFKLDSARKAYNIVIFVVAVFMLAVMVMTFEASLEKSLDIKHLIFVLVGCLFVVIGNYLSKVPKNFFFGIRTPWTLASDKVWYKTHRFGSWVFIICGLLVILIALLGLGQNLIIGLLVTTALLPVLYSLFSYYKIEGFKTDSE